MPEFKQRELHYFPYPTLDLFHSANEPVRGILGPTGSGKSVGMIGEMMFRAFQQAPDAQGFRPTRWAVVRESYPALYSTTLNTWKTWVPHGKINMSPPIRWSWKQANVMADGTGVDMEVMFISASDPDDIGKLRSLDVTGVWLNEAQEIQDRLLVEWMFNRTGRYPETQRAPLTWSGLIMDANAMDTDHWWYDWAEVSKPAGYKFFRQPPAVIKNDNGEWVINPNCENRTGQPKGDTYWLEQIPGKHESWVKLNFCAEYGQTSNGRLVYPEFEEMRHVSKEDLKPIPGLPLQGGVDFGLTPAIVLCQITPQGQLRILDELNAVSMGMRQFLRDVVKPILANQYPGYPVSFVGEPSGNRRAESDESTAMDEFRAQGLDIRPAPTNLFKPRRDAVASFMLKRVVSSITGQPTAEGFLVSPKCKMLLKGWREKYILQRVKVEKREIWKDEAVGNGFDHGQDALAALCTAYDRPRRDAMSRDRMFGGDGKPFEITQAKDYPMI
jgi:hypothetical protein